MINKKLKLMCLTWISLLLSSCVTNTPENCWRWNEELLRTDHKTDIVKCKDWEIYSITKQYYFANAQPSYLTYKEFWKWAEYLWDWLIRYDWKLYTKYHVEIDISKNLKVEDLKKVWEFQFESNWKYYFYSNLKSLEEIEFNWIIEKVNDYLSKDNKYVYDENWIIIWSDAESFHLDWLIYKDKNYSYWTMSKRFIDYQKVNEIRNQSKDDVKTSIYSNSNYEYINEEIWLAKYNWNIVLWDNHIIVEEWNHWFEKLSDNWFYKSDKWVYVFHRESSFWNANFKFYEWKDYELLNPDFLYVKDRNLVIWHNKNVSNQIQYINSMKWDSVEVKTWFLFVNWNKYNVNKRSFE